ncbi:DUF11 domain-containing protein [Ramlibacter sp. USB13]|uniref:DUF11 domain-containing protein n=1 Tax=Ramlibacter cellulosilyticus TaxID=2764187 RepID=A0A923MMX4_9BURK|nr:CshA/CshB family fibrillar adhesin-related protein [Ramlibacter cellulosilyticus]MBC5781364.1 DUF11 domain-containing protein [Ramlibacter cellulosilyticus]
MKRVLVMICRFLLACVLGVAAFLAAPGSANAAGCAPATTQGTAPADFRTYCWLDLTGYNDGTASSGTGQNFSFTLPDGTTVSFNLKRTGGALTTVAVPSWTGSAFGNAAFNGIPGRPILYQATNGTTVTVTISAISVVPPTGGSAQYSMIVGDGESSNGGESLRFTTTGGNWTRIATIYNTGSTTLPGVTGEGTQQVDVTGVNGTVGSFVWRSDNNPKQITARMVGSGLQGVIIGMRYASVSVVSQITGQRYNAADQFTYRLGTNTGTVLASGSTTSTATSGFAVASVPTVAASYPFVVSQVMAAGSVGTLANYTTSLTCTNSTSGTGTTMPTNVSGNSYTFNSLAYGDAILCTFTNTPIFNTIVGTVYHDINHNGARDGPEGGPGVAGFYVKIAPVSGGTCTGPATQYATVDASSGAYTLPNLAQGTYCVILDNNTTLSDITPTLPAGWLPTESPSGVLQVSVPAGSPTPVPQDFGVYNGSRLAGTVFADVGTGGGTANNGAKDGSEAGLATVTVTASSGATAVASAQTAGDGTFTLWVPATATGTLTLSATPPAGYLATGGSAGTTGGSYTRPNVTYPSAAGQVYSGVLFGLVPPNTFTPNGAQTAQAGSVVFYAHTFQAGSGGQVSFSLANVASPANTGWNAIVYRDANCSASLDGTEPALTAPVTVTAGQQVCLVVKQFVPSGTAFGALNTVTATAAFTYTNASPALSANLAVTDVTTVGEPTALSLRKLVANVTRGGTASTSVNATPGELLQYTLTAQNNGGGPLSTLVINDATPAFTVFVSAACPGTLPAGITGCTIASQPAAGGTGGVQWTFTGTLAASAQLVVSYQVRLSQ